MMKLYTRWQNSAGERVRIALNLKGIAYDYVAAKTLRPGDYARINPQELLPALEVEGQVITQSSAILDYLELAYPAPPLLPKSSVLRAQAIAFGSVIVAEMHALTVTRVRKFLADDLAVNEDKVGQWVTHWQTHGFSTLEQLLLARSTQWDFCFGDEPGWGDLFLVPQVANGQRLGIDLAAFPVLTKIAERCEILEAFRLARPESQPDYPGDGA